MLYAQHITWSKSVNSQRRRRLWALGSSYKDTGEKKWICCFRKEIKQSQSKKKTKNHVVRELLFILDGLTSPDLCLTLISLFHSFIQNSSILSSIPLSIHPPLCLSVSRPQFIMQQTLVGEALTGLFPATGCAPLVLALHSVHLAALFGLATTLPADEKTHIQRMSEAKKKKKVNQ